MCQVHYKTVSVFAVANRILEEGRRLNLPISDLKMQKLVYFAQGFALVQLHHPLFREEIQAWTYGPVIPELYHALKRFGEKPITGALRAPDSIEDDTPEAAVIKDVMDTLGDWTAGQLVALSHRDDSPWAAAWSKARYARIELWQMVLYFTKLLQPSAPATEA